MLFRITAELGTLHFYFMEAGIAQLSPIAQLSMLALYFLIVGSMCKQKNLWDLQMLIQFLHLTLDKLVFSLSLNFGM